VQRNILLKQNGNIKAKSRFTKSFYFLSTVFVDNFVENEEINWMALLHKVYGLLNIALWVIKIYIKNQTLASGPRAGEKLLPIISAVKKIVHKSG
jgi:hypothetical protein